MQGAACSCIAAPQPPGTVTLTYRTRRHCAAAVPSLAVTTSQRDQSDHAVYVQRLARGARAHACCAKNVTGAAVAGPGSPPPPPPREHTTCPLPQRGPGRARAHPARTCTRQGLRTGTPRRRRRRRSGGAPTQRPPPKAAAQSRARRARRPSRPSHSPRARPAAPTRRRRRRASSQRVDTPHPPAPPPPPRPPPRAAQPRAAGARTQRSRHP